MDKSKDIFFYIFQFRGMFKRILVIYALIFLGFLYLVYSLYSIEEPKFYAASRSGMLRPLQPFEASEIQQIYNQRG